MAVRYAEACGLAAQGQYDEARRIYAKLDAVLAGAESEARLRALIRSDLDAVAAIDRRFEEALAGWRAALEIDPDCLMARLNRDLIEAELSFGQMIGDLGELKLARAPVPSHIWETGAASAAQIFILPGSTDGQGKRARLTPGRRFNHPAGYVHPATAPSAACAEADGAACYE